MTGTVLRTASYNCTTAADGCATASDGDQQRAARSGTAAHRQVSGGTRVRRLTGGTAMISATMRRVAGGLQAAWSTWARAGAAGAAIAAVALGCLLAANPAVADPGTSIPDSGSRPQAIGDLLLPGQGGSGQTTTIPANPAIGPLATQINTQTAAVELLGEQVTQAGEELDRARQAMTTADQHLTDTQRLASDLRRKADSEAADVFKRGTELGPFSDYATQLHQFSRVAPGVIDQPGGEALSRDLLRATKEIEDARAALTAATAATAAAQTQYDTLKASFDRQSADLEALKSRNTAELVRIQKEQDAYEQSLAGKNLSEINIDGKMANPLALQAVLFALQQAAEGDMYLWGATGPDRWDCSGLVLRAYQSVGYYKLPRVANDQYYSSAIAGKAIQSTKYSRGDLLLPGDIVFFSSDPTDWRKIHHVGIYIGSGKMVHAPSSGNPVQAGPVHWSELFGAVRIFKEVNAPTQNPTSNPPISNPPTSNPPTSNPPTSTPPASNPPTSNPPVSDPPSPSPSPSDPEPSPQPSASSAVSASSRPSDGASPPASAGSASTS